MYMKCSWKVNVNTPSLIEDNTGRIIAQALPLHGGRNDKTEINANAELIAAAPDLFDACKEAEIWFNCAPKNFYPKFKEIWNKISLAIAKATLKSD